MASKNTAHSGLALANLHSSPPLLFQTFLGPFCSSRTPDLCTCKLQEAFSLLNSYTSIKALVPKSFPLKLLCLGGSASGSEVGALGTEATLGVPDVCRRHSGLTGSLFCSAASTNRTYRWPGSRPLLSKPPYCFWSPGWKVCGSTEKRAAM